MYRESKFNCNEFEIMDRYFSLIKDGIKGVEKGQQYTIEANKLILQAIGAEREILENFENYMASQTSLDNAVRMRKKRLTTIISREESEGSICKN